MKMSLTIRKMKESDLGPLYLLLSDPLVMKYMEPPYSMEETEAFLKSCGLTDEPRIYAVDNEEGFAGYIIFHHYEDDSMEIGWVLYPKYWGRGYASELTIRLIAKGFTIRKALIIECDPEQEISKHIAEKHGFEHLGRKDGLDIYRLKPRL